MQVIMHSIVIISDNVSFSATDDNGERYQFLVSREAIDDAAEYRGLPGEQIDRYGVFINYMDDILRIAEELVKLGITLEPIVITTEMLNP